MLIHSFRYAAAGIRRAIKTETSFRSMLVCLLVVLAAGLLLRITAWEWVAVLICCGGILAIELINTSIEVLVDILSPQYQPKAKTAKDVAAGATLVWALISVTVGLIIFIPYFIDLFRLV